MAISKNPTKTLTIEKNWQRDISKRWRSFQSDVVGELTRQNILANAETPFSLDMSQIRTYMAFYQSKIDELLLGLENPNNWQNRYQLLAYERGLERSRAMLISEGAGIEPTMQEQLAAQGIRTFTAVPTLATGTIAQPIHQEALEFLYARSYDSLKGWTDNLAKETRQILVSAAQEGKGVRAVQREIIDRIGVSKSRALTIARTETNQAFSRAQINQADEASKEIGEEIKVRWLTRLDDRVRHNHVALHGKVLTTQEAAKVKNNDGINCRCGLAPVVPGSDTEAKQKKFKEERERMLEMGG